MKRKTLKPNWSDKHKDYMARAMGCTVSVAEGAVRAGKTVDNVAVFARMLSLGVRDRIHLATGSTSANAKMNIGDCNGYGLEHIFRGKCHWGKYKGNEALMINVNRRRYIVIFAGAGKADSYKKIRGNSYGMWIATEINLHHDSSIKEAMNRQLAAVTRRIFWDLNPSSPANFIYTDYIDKFPEAFGAKYNYGHFTIRDNANISAERFAEIEASYDPKSIWYKRDILGVRCSAEGLVYDMFNPDIHVLHEEPKTEGPFFVSSDFGIQNATVFLLWRRIAGKNAWVCLREYFYSGRDEHRQKTVAELADGLQGMLGDIVPEKTIIDPSATSLIVEVKKRGYKTREADNDVKNGIADVATMLFHEELFFMETCKNTISEFSVYQWDAKASEAGEDKPVKEHDHGMDAVRYFVKTNKLVKRDKRGDKANSRREINQRRELLLYENLSGIV